METCVLIPSEFSLVLTTSPTPTGQFREMGVRVWTNERIPRGTKFYPFQGTIRLDKLEIYSYLDDGDARNRFGCYDEIQVVDKHRVRHCNWVRFLRFSFSHSHEVNLVGSKIKGEPVFETTKSIPPHSELVAYFAIDDRNNSDLLLANAERLANCTYREAMGMLIEHSPLDLSMSLLSSRILITPPSDADDRISPTSDISPIMSCITSFSPVPRRNRERTLLPCEEKPHKCTMCSKSFPTPGDLKSHMYVHSGSWPFKCHICNRGFSKQTNLKNHLFLHTGDKPHVCELCNKRFALACNLRAHMKTHDDDPQEDCIKCNRSFLSSSNVLIHGYCSSCYMNNQGGSENEDPLLKVEAESACSSSQRVRDNWSPDSPLEEDEEDDEEEVDDEDEECPSSPGVLTPSPENFQGSLNKTTIMT
ncbi:hypothetical protein CHUAL_010607 [Chamberlinius hualienensis]